MTCGFRSTLGRVRHRLTPYWSTSDLPVPAADPAAVLTAAWVSGVAAAGGTLTATSESIIAGLATALTQLTAYDHILYMVPLCGANIVAATVPLIDRASIGNMVNMGLPGSAYSEATGVTGTGASRFDLNCFPGELAADYGGIGLWYGMRSFSNALPNIPFGSYHSSGNASTALLLYPASRNWFSYGVAPQAAGRYLSHAAASIAGDYYGQDPGPSQSLGFYYNGTAIAGATSGSLAAYNYPELKLGLMGCNYGSGSLYSRDRCGCAMITDGHLSATQIAEIYAVIDDWLYTPTGR